MGLLTHEAEYLKFQQNSNVSFNQVKKKVEGKKGNILQYHAFPFSPFCIPSWQTVPFTQTQMVFINGRKWGLCIFCNSKITRIACIMQ